MKKIVFFLILTLFVFYSCEKDNYEAPDAAIEGTITDTNGTPLQLEQGSSSARIRMDEVSWSETPLPFYLNFKMDGTYVNSKIFSGRYAINAVEGSFYPILADTIDISGTVTHDFTVTPYLDVSWIGDPVVGTDGIITAKFKFTRNAGPNGESMPNVQDYQLFISTTQYVGNNNFDSNVVAGAVSANNDMTGQELTISTTTAMKYSTTYYVRIGVRVNDSFKKYNYTDVKTVAVP